MSAGSQLLSPAVLASLSNLELVARTAVHGFLTGLHRSPQFGFSQEFREYRAYAEGDDPRFVDWNVYARTDRTYIRRFEGETNTQLMLLLDASASMGYTSPRASVDKMLYAKFLAAALAYLGARQHDPVGLIVFDERVRLSRPATSRTGSLQSLIHAIDGVTTSGGTSIAGSFDAFREHLSRRSLVVLISDLYCEPLALRKAIQPLASRGHDVAIFHVLDPHEISPQWEESVLLEDAESRTAVNIAPEFLRERYAGKFQQHVQSLRAAVVGAGADYTMLSTDQPLDAALRRYLLFRERRN